MGKASFATVQDIAAAACSSTSTTKASAPTPTKRSSTGIWATSLPPRAYCSKPTTGELSVRTPELRLLTKSLRRDRRIPRPDRPEQKYRQRYLDLITNENRADFHHRSKIVQKDPQVHEWPRLPGNRNTMMHPDSRQRVGQTVSVTTTMRWTCRCTCVLRLNCI